MRPPSKLQVCSREYFPPRKSEPVRFQRIVALCSDMSKAWRHGSVAARWIRSGGNDHVSRQLSADEPRSIDDLRSDTQSPRRSGRTLRRQERPDSDRDGTGVPRSGTALVLFWFPGGRFTPPPGVIGVSPGDWIVYFGFKQ